MATKSVRPEQASGGIEQLLLLACLVLLFLSLLVTIARLVF